MKITGLVIGIIKSLTLEKAVRFTARRTADFVFYSVPLVRDPKLTAAIYVTHRITKIAATKYKRIDTDPQQIFEDAIDAVSEAY